MYRHNTKVNGKEYKVGKYQSCPSKLLRNFEKFLDNYSHLNSNIRHLGHSRTGIFQWTSPILLLWCSRSYSSVWCQSQGYLLEPEGMAQRNETSQTGHSFHCDRKQNRYRRESNLAQIQVCRRFRVPLQLCVRCWWHERGGHLPWDPRYGNQIQGGPGPWGLLQGVRGARPDILNDDFL